MNFHWYKNRLRCKTREDCLCLLKIGQGVSRSRIFTCNGSDIFKLQHEHSGMKGNSLCLAL